jgi:hypothetical protein
MTPYEDDNFEPIASEEEDLEDGLPVYRIRSYPSDPDLETLHGRWNRGELVIPTFQRGFVWKPSQASRLIESFLMGLPVPGIFVFVRETDGDESTSEQLVVDGQQRLRSVFGFFDGKLPDGKDFALTGVAPRWEGKTFKTLDPSEQGDLRRAVLRVVNIEQRVPKHGESSVYQVFERLNTGGTTLTPQEIRNSSYHGPFNDMLVDTNRNADWREVFGTPVPDSRMRDVELVARFLALNEGLASYTKPMRKFINDFMDKHKRIPGPHQHRQIFEATVLQVHEKLGSRPFHVRRGINVAVFDSVMVAFAGPDQIPDDIVERYQALIADQDFVKATTRGTTDINNVHDRVNLAKQILFKS